MLPTLFTAAPDNHPALVLWRSHRLRRTETAAFRSTLRKALCALLDCAPTAQRFVDLYLDPAQIPVEEAIRLTRPYHSPKPLVKIVNRVLTVEINPKYHDILYLCLETIPLQHAESGYDFGEFLAQWLYHHIDPNGLAHQEIERFLNPEPGNPVRQVCENLAPFSIVPPPPRAPAEPIPQGDRLLRLWNDFQKSRAIQRLDSRELKNHLPELGRLLAAKHRELARWGRAGRFHAFLRQHQIPRQTAYRLMTKFDKYQTTKDINCTKREIPDVVLRADSVSFRLEFEQCAIAHRILQDSERTAKYAYRVPEYVARALFDYVRPSYARDRIANMFTTDPSRFRARRFFTKPREYFDKIPQAAPMDFQALAKLTPNRYNSAPTRYYHRPWLRSSSRRS